MVLALLIEWSHFDLFVADWVYAMEGRQWQLREHFVSSALLHEGGRSLVQLIGLALLLLAITSSFNARLAPYKRGLWMLFMTLALGPALVAIAKAFTHVDCPWDLIRYGGTLPYLPIFEPHPGDYDYGRCFPSGHASGGYGLIGLYFFLRHHKPEWKWYGLAVGIVMGLVFGMAQQLRGAHFFSHDLWSLAICWLCALFSDWQLFGKWQTITSGHIAATRHYGVINQQRDFSKRSSLPDPGRLK